MSAQVIVDIVEDDANTFNIRINTHKGADSTDKELRIADDINSGIALLGRVCCVICEKEGGGAK